MYRVVVAVCILIAPMSGCGLQLPDDLSLPTQITGGDPRTLEAATAAAQERQDRFSSRDFAGAWLISSKQMQAAISQADYTTFQETCASALSRLPTTVTGVRMDGNDRAIVREDVMGFKNSITMVYEDGKWVQAPSDFWIQSAGKTASQLIAERTAAGHCGNDLSPPPIVATTSPTPSPTPTTTSQPPLRMPATTDVRVDRPGGYAHLVAVRLARNDGYDRLVMEFADRVPSYSIGYRPLPAHTDGSGEEIPLPGASAVVQVTLTQAAADWDFNNHDYQGPYAVTADTAVVTEAKEAGDFEAVLSWVVGLRATVPFSVLVFGGPPRLVIDFQH